ncbi:MAG: ABC transporter permease [Verrucomicrobiota bacterium]|nr:MAG: ABC transporter permease [Verrucomicrobiota bacterium]
MYEIVEHEELHIFEDLSVVHVCCSGMWALRSHVEDLQELGDLKSVKQIILDADKMVKLSSAFLIFLQHLQQLSQKAKIPLVTTNLPSGAQKIFNLQQAQLPQQAKKPMPDNFFYQVGVEVMAQSRTFYQALKFFGQVLTAISRAVVRPSLRIWARVIPFFQSTGVEALPVVTLISALVGLIMAFVSVVQLERFGASIYVADLVALAMTREMGCLMIGVIIAGRTGAAFAATIGSMQVNEELDALQTFGIDRISYLVLPRVVALALMMPLLCIFADVIGILGGMFSALPFIPGSMTQYLAETKKALGMGDILLGLIKSFCFGGIIAGIGCFQGACCGRNATAVGQASTTAVVQGITWIIIADAIFALITTALGI